MPAKRHVEFKEEPTDILVLKNRPAELRCKVSGDGNTKITWLKDGASLNLAGDTRRTILADGTLKFSYIIRKKNNSDEGQYQCVASTDVKGFTFRIVSQKAKVTVAGKSKCKSYGWLLDKFVHSLEFLYKMIICIRFNLKNSSDTDFFGGGCVVQI